MLRFDSQMLNNFRHTPNDAMKLINDNGGMALRMIMDSARLDADETYFFARQLEYFKKRSADVLYPEFLGSWICPVSNEADTGSENITYAQYEGIGAASVINNEAKDYKNIEIRSKEFTQPARTIGVSIKWNIQELRAAALKAKRGNTQAGKGATERKTDWAIKSIREKEERIIAQGDDDFGLIGFYNNSKIQEMTSGAGANQIKLDGSGNKANWTTKDALKVIRDFNQVVNYIPDQTHGVHKVNTVLMPVKYRSHLQTLQVPNTNTSVLAYLQSVHPGVEVVAYPRVNLAAARTGGALTEDWVIAYQREPSILTQEIPQTIEVLPPLQVGHGAFEAAVRERHAGIMIYYPKACLRVKISR